MDPNKCLDVYNHIGPSVQTYNCEDSESQKWDYDETAHTLKSNGKCLSSLISYEVTEVWAGNLADGAYAVLLVNRASFNNTIEITWEEIGFNGKKAKLRDLWAKKDLGEFEDKYSITLEKHDSQFLKVWPIEDDDNTIMIILIVAASVIVISVILVLVFYFKMKKPKMLGTDDIEEDKLIDSRAKTEN